MTERFKIGEGSIVVPVQNSERIREFFGMEYLLQGKEDIAIKRG